MKRIVALDPGGTTGVATVKIDDAGVCTWSWDQLGPQEHHHELWTTLCDELANTGDLTIVCESFEFRQNRQRDNINLMSREYIGVVKLFSATYGTPVVFQTAGLAKPFVTDAKLKVMDLWVPGQKHAMDATRHAVTFMIQKLKMVKLIDSWKELT